MADPQTCYFPDGTVARGDTPCNSLSVGEGSSACCAEAHICLSNSLCLHTDGQEAIARGSCTDKTWQSSECAQYCSDVNPSSATGINLVDVDGHPLFCCGNMNPFNNTCLTSSKGSSSPFYIQAGLVIFNRTSASTSPNSTETATIIITSTATAAPITIKSTMTTTATPITIKSTITTTAMAKPTGTATIPNSPYIPITSSSPSSRRETAIAAGVSSSLGLGLLVALGLLWKQKKQKQSLRKDVQMWEGKYSELMKTKTVNVGGAEPQPSHRLDGWPPNELDDQSRRPAPLESCRPNEIDGAQIYEAANRIARA